MLDFIIRHLRRNYTGVSWRNSFFNSLFLLMDNFDYIARAFRGYSDLPKYSIRVRSIGIARQFGGRRFATEGEVLTKLVHDYAGLSPDKSVLDIGCGCGRLAFPLSNILSDGCYTGMDIEKISLAACKKNKRLSAKGFRFDLMDIQNTVYNPTGSQKDSTYTFPYPDGSFSIVILFSVFTHMLPSGVCNYIREIVRLLKPSGRCVFSTFLIDFDFSQMSYHFPFKYQDYAVHKDKKPEKKLVTIAAFLKNNSIHMG